MFISDLGLDRKVFRQISRLQTVIKHTIIPSPRYFAFCNVLYIYIYIYIYIYGTVPTYRVYRLYDIITMGLVQNLDSGLWTGAWTGLWTGLVTTITGYFCE